MIAAVDTHRSNWDGLEFVSVLSCLQMISPQDMPLTLIGALSTDKQEIKIGPAILTKHWNIGLEQAKQTLEATTQCGVHTVMESHLSRGYKTNDRQLCYRQLSYPLFTDTLEASVKSRFWKNQYTQCLHLNLVGYEYIQ